MKSYPSIQFWNKGHFGQKVWGFDKLDGSQIRIEWSKKRGFYKFGSKNILIDEHSFLAKAIPLFQNKYANDLEKIFRDTKEFRNTDSFVLFAEFFGSDTFAGLHFPEDDSLDVVIYDVSQYKKGMLTPKEFLDNFGHLHIPELVYEGNYNKQLVDDVFYQRGYTLTEGLVCKGVTKTKGRDQVWMVKVKTQEWLLKLKERSGIEALIAELNNDSGLVKEVNTTMEDT